MEPTNAVPPEEAARTLGRVNTVREMTRERLRPYSLGLFVFGVLTLVSSRLLEVWDGAGVALFWLLATPPAIFVVARHQRAQMRAEGAAPSGRPYAIEVGTFTVAVVALSVISGATGEPDIANYGIGLAFAVSGLVWAWLEPNVRGDLRATVLLAYAVLGFVALQNDDPASLFTVIAGLYFALRGWEARKWEAASQQRA